MSIKVGVESSRIGSGFAEVPDINLSPFLLGEKKTPFLLGDSGGVITGVIGRKKHKAVLPVTTVEAQSYSTSWSAGMKFGPLEWEGILGCWPALTGCWVHPWLCCGCQCLTPGLVGGHEEVGA